MRPIMILAVLAFFATGLGFAGYHASRGTRGRHRAA
jgi:hypothetical protein